MRVQSVDWSHDKIATMQECSEITDISLSRKFCWILNSKNSSVLEFLVLIDCDEKVYGL